MPNLEGFMRLALRAQSQCRATLETLSAIKNPPILYARQANVTTGPQQNNFGVAARGESKSAPTEPLEIADGERLDFGASAETVGGDKAVETVDAKHRA